MQVTVSHGKAQSVDSVGSSVVGVVYGGLEWDSDNQGGRW